MRLSIVVRINYPRLVATDSRTREYTRVLWLLISPWRTTQIWRTWSSSNCCRKSRGLSSNRLVESVDRSFHRNGARDFAENCSASKDFTAPCRRQLLVLKELPIAVEGLTRASNRCQKWSSPSRWKNTHSRVRGGGSLHTRTGKTFRWRFYWSGKQCQAEGCLF